MNKIKEIKRNFAKAWTFHNETGDISFPDGTLFCEGDKIQEGMLLVPLNERGYGLGLSFSYENKKTNEMTKKEQEDSFLWGVEVFQPNQVDEAVEFAEANNTFTILQAQENGDIESVVPNKWNYFEKEDVYAFWHIGYESFPIGRINASILFEYLEDEIAPGILNLGRKGRMSFVDVLSEEELKEYSLYMDQVRILPKDFDVLDQNELKKCAYEVYL